MFAKKNIFKTMVALTLSVCVVIFSSCALFGGKIKDKLPDEEVVSIERVTVDATNGGEETAVALSTDKWDTFFGIIEELEYVKFYNILGVKQIPLDEVFYVITYETYKIEFSEHRITFYKDGEWQKQTRFSSISPMESYNQLTTLFNE